MSPDRRAPCAVLTTVLALALSGCGAGRAETPATETPATETPATETPATETPAPATGAEPVTRVVRRAGVRVAVPASWERLDTSDCLWRRGRWAPAGSDPCRGYAGLAFFSSALYDTFRGPGVYRDDDGGWSGYVIRDGVVVQVADPEREVVRAVLDSAAAH